MKRANPLSLLLALALIASGALAGCTNKADNAEKAPAKAEAPTTPDAAPTDKADPNAPGQTPAPTDAAPAADGECANYAKEVCTIVGGDISPSCQAFKMASELMPPAACKAGLADLDFTRNAQKSMASKCTVLVDRLCKDLGEDTQTCKLVRDKTPGFPPDRCAQMLDSYDQVLSELQGMEAMNKPLEADAMAKIAATDAASFGKADATVTIVEFSDFQCPYCSRAAEVASQVKAKYSDKVRFVFRHFPLPFHQDAHLAHQAAIAAGEQGKFWEMHDLLFKNQQNLKPEDLQKYGQELGLDMAKYKKALDDKAHAAKVDADLEMGKGVNVGGTPTMFINGTRVQNPSDFELVSNLIEKNLADGK